MSGARSFKYDFHAYRRIRKRCCYIILLPPIHRFGISTLINNIVDESIVFESINNYEYRMGQRWFFFFPSIEDELFALPRSTSTKCILRVVETAIPFPVGNVRRSFENSCLDRAYGTTGGSSAGNSLRKTIVLPVVRAKLWRQTGFEDIPELLFFAPVRLYLDEGIL